MPNKSSVHGGSISEGTIIHGTLRAQDLLLAFADELNRVLPFNGNSLAHDARRAVDTQDEDANEILCELIDQLDTIAQREGFYFGTHEGDGSDFGYWRLEAEQED
jgi:hypothetical protein